MNIDKREVVSIIAGEFGVDEPEVTDDANFVDDLDADSLDLTNLAMALEEAFKVEIPDADIDKLTSLGRVMAYLTEVTRGRR